MYAQQVSFASSTTEYDYTQINLEYSLGQFTLQNDISETLSMTGSLIELETLLRIFEGINLCCGTTTSAHCAKVVTDILSLSDSIHVLKDDFLSDSITYDATLSGVINKINRIIEVYGLNTTVTNSAEFTTIVSAVLALVDSVTRGLNADVIEELIISEELSQRLTAYSNLIDNMLFGEALQNLSFSLVISEAINFSETTSTQAIFSSILTDELTAFGTLNFDGDQFLAYTVNTQSLGISEYTNYNFNSFSYPYAATSTGIYKIDDGGSDNGTNSDASIKTGIMDFGTSLKKQVPYAYLGITENGRVLLKTISTDRGVKKERWYEVQSYNSALDTTRVRMGKGVKAKYWQFELSNIEGENLSLESMEVLPIALARRKQ